MRQLIVILTAVAVAAFQTRAGILDCVFDAVNKDEIARLEAEFLVMDGVSHPSSATFTKVQLVDKDGTFTCFTLSLPAQAPEHAPIARPTWSALSPRTERKAPRRNGAL
jgi:hypothetical protein